MLYSLTEKLKFDEDPQIAIKDKVLTVKADAETVLTLLSLIEEKGEMKATLEAVDLLFSPADRKTIHGLKLSFDDYTKLIEVATALALGNDPDEKKGE